MPLKLLILGATGGTGRQLVSQALDRGHDVTVLVRTQDRLGVDHGPARVLIARLPDDAEALRAAMRDQDAVISALGVGQSLKSGGLITSSVPVILQSMESTRVRRIVFTSAFGVGETIRDVPLVPRILIRLVLKDVYADKAAGETVLRQSNLDWTIVYPATLTNGIGTGRYRVGERLALRGVPKVSRADLAHFLLSQLDDRRFIRKGVLITNA